MDEPPGPPDSLIHPRKGKFDLSDQVIHNKLPGRANLPAHGGIKDSEGNDDNDEDEEARIAWVQWQLKLSDISSSASVNRNLQIPLRTQNLINWAFRIRSKVKPQQLFLKIYCKTILPIKPFIYEAK